MLGDELRQLPKQLHSQLCRGDSPRFCLGLGWGVEKCGHGAIRSTAWPGDLGAEHSQVQM